MERTVGQCKLVQLIGKLLGLRPVSNLDESVVCHLVLNTLPMKFGGQPVVTIEIDLQPAGQPSGHTHIAQAQFIINEIEIVVEALAVVRPQVRFTLPVCLSCHGLYVEHGSIAERIQTMPGRSPRFDNAAFTRSSFRTLLLRMNSVS